MILLLLSAALVLYPAISALIQALDAIGDLYSVPQALLTARDNAIMQVLGLVILYVFLYFFLNSCFERQPFQSNQQIEPIETEKLPQEPKPVQTKRTPPLSGRIKTRIVIISSLVFIGIFIWQYIDIYTTGNHNPVNSAIAPIFYGIIASGITGTVLYLLFKHVFEIEE